MVRMNINRIQISEAGYPLALTFNMNLGRVRMEISSPTIKGHAYKMF